MKFSSCIKCRCDEYVFKSAKLSTINNDNNIFSIPKIDVFYIKICKRCGYTEMYDAKLVDECVKKNPSSI